MNYLTHIEILPSNEDYFPYNLPLIKNGVTIDLKQPITFIVGENGSGKSTFLEGLASAVGFNPMGGNANHNYAVIEEYNIKNALKLTWKLKTKKGFFFRAESFYNFSNYIDKMIDEDIMLSYAYGGKKLTSQSHGESFLSLFESKFKDGLFILDEPEAALSPERQMSLVAILNDLVTKNNAQFIIATHSPILIATPNSVVYEIENSKFIEKNYEETKQFNLYKDFLNNSRRYINYLTKE